MKPFAREGEKMRALVVLLGIMVVAALVVHHFDLHHTFRGDRYDPATGTYVSAGKPIG